ncbi:VOC family protein [Streptomyces cadmiisoli]|uniref:VOC family protein n=1 Tax=Streptomyces cadmiisoli TaxID=2184053 RepID=UPI003654BBF0
MPDPGKDLHLDLAPDDDQQADLSACPLGAKRLDPSPGNDDGAVLLPDPDGNVFRVLRGQ